MPYHATNSSLSFMLLICGLTACLPQQQFSQASIISYPVVQTSDPLSPKAIEATKLPALKSEPLKVDEKYKKLQTLLTAKNFKAADQETQRLVLQIYPLDHPERYDVPNWKPGEISCRELQTINRLWERSSNGKFGWAIQKRIFKAAKQQEREAWQNIEAETDPAAKEQLQENYEDALTYFWRQVGWTFFEESPGSHRSFKLKNYNQVTFTLDAPIGHLPTFALWTGQKGGITGWFWDKTLVPRLDACNL